MLEQQVQSLKTVLIALASKYNNHSHPYDYSNNADHQWDSQTGVPDSQLQPGTLTSAWVWEP